MPLGSGCLSRPGTSDPPLYEMIFAASDLTGDASEYETGGLRAFRGLRMRGRRGIQPSYLVVVLISTKSPDDRRAPRADRAALPRIDDEVRVVERVARRQHGVPVGRRLERAVAFVELLIGHRTVLLVQREDHLLRRGETSERRDVRLTARVLVAGHRGICCWHIRFLLAVNMSQLGRALALGMKAAALRGALLIPREDRAGVLRDPLATGRAARIASLGDDEHRAA